MNDILQQYGYDASITKHISPHALAPARIIFLSRGTGRVMTADGVRDAVLAGTLYGQDHGAPVVGDWVGFEEEAGTARIRVILPRRTELVRGTSGGGKRPQPIAANVDTVFIVQAFGAVNVRRMERYIAATRAGGAQPVVLMNKADTLPDTERAEAFMDVARAAGSVTVMEVSAVDGLNVERIRAMIPSGSTAVFTGSSGVGKSTLVNALLDEDRQSVASIRAGDAKGRHTTTSREMFPLPGCGVVIDTPGMREFALWDSGEGLAEVFADLESLAENCRFSDCTHAVEPGCAVLAARDAGDIDADRVASWQKLKREAEARPPVEGYLKAEDRKKWKRFGRLVKEAKDLKKRF